VETILIGVSIASILFLVALGLAIIYGAMKVINLAHGEMVMIGAYVAVLATKHLGVSLYTCIPMAFIVTAAIGYGLEVLIVRRLYGRLLDTLLATWGVSLILQQLIRIHLGLGLFGIHIDGLGSDLQNVQVPALLRETIRLGDVNIPTYRAFVLIVAVLLGGFTWWLMYRTHFGAQLRAVSVARGIASCCGINEKRINSLAFAYGSGLAGIAGVMVSGFKTVSPDMGTPYVIDAFLVVVAGGVGHLFGTVASAGILGELQSFVSSFLNDVYGRTAVFAAVIAVLLWKPHGLFAPRSR
jgi:urea transport system permease protein